MKRSFGWWLAAGTLIACGTAQPTTPQAAAVETTSSVAQPAPPPASTPQPAKPEPPPATAATTEPSAQPAVPDAPPTWNEGDPVDGWFASKGIGDVSSLSLLKLANLPASRNLECDRVVPVGKPVGQGALCRRQYLDAPWVQATSFVVLAVEQGKVRVVWESLSAAGLLSRHDMSEQAFAQLLVSMRDDGEELSLEDWGDTSCDAARTKLTEAKKDAEEDDKPSHTSLERLIGRVCQARGRYAWRGGRYVRTGAVPATRSSK